MLPTLHLDSLLWADPLRRWLLIAPAILLTGWCWQVLRRRRDARRLSQHRPLPIVERIPMLGAWSFWLFAVAALAATIIAAARPQAEVGRVRSAGVDLIILQDGSASMHVRDIAPDRWQRSTRFLRMLAESLRWNDDRIALALFAHIAAPQVRLTRDPNTFFFFLDHLDREPPFPLKDDTTWDTNIELGLYWGTRLVDKDEALNGRSANTRAFVLVSDGQAWSGDIERALQLARSRDIAVFTVGVGTAAGGSIPDAPPETTLAETEHPVAAMSSLRSRLDRTSLVTIANAGGGEYFDLDRQGDRQIAATIIDSARRRAGPRGVDLVTEELYWPTLVLGAALLCVGAFFLRDRAELCLYSLGASGAVFFLWTFSR